jgi:hypothetical protein
LPFLICASLSVTARQGFAFCTMRAEARQF